MTTPIDISPEAVERWHEELSGMVAGKPLYEGQTEYVLASDFDALCLQLTAAESRAVMLRQALDVVFTDDSGDLDFIKFKIRQNLPGEKL